MEHGFVGPLDISPEMFHPDLQPVASFIREATSHGAKGFSKVLLHLIQSSEPGNSQDLLRAKIADVAQEVHHRPEDLYKSADIVRQYDLAKRRQHLLWRMNAAHEQGEPITDFLRQLEEIEAGDDTRKGRSLIVVGVNSFPTAVPPETVLLGDGWGRWGDVLTLISTAGAGKSVAMIQAAIAWGLGLPYLGIHPARPLRILLFSGEDDGATIGQCREGFMEHSAAITGRQLVEGDLEPLDRMLRTEFSREHVGERFHSHLNRLLRESPADLVIINPLLSYIGGEIVACASQWLRAGLMPILQQHECAALLAHHTGKMAKDGWENTDDTYSAIGGGEMANVPRAILTLRPAADGLSVLKVAKRPTTGWKDANGCYTKSYFLRRSGDPTRPAWLPVDSDEVQNFISDSKPSGSGGKSSKKVTSAHVVGALKVGPTQRQALIERLMEKRCCSNRTASNAIIQAESDKLILSFTEPNRNGGMAIKWLQLPEHSNQ